MTSYSGVADHTTDRLWERIDNTPSGILYADSAVRIADITDGTSHTLMLAESVVSQDDPFKQDTMYCPGGGCTVGRAWSEGNLVTTVYGINCPPKPVMTTYAPWAWHPGQAGFGFADGHGSFISQNIDQTVLVALTTRRPGTDTAKKAYGGEVIQGDY
jgi:prepilin-type processing-associated H-X9-DG protein